jgi:cytochrome c oxidase assembly protein subunit 15
VRLAIHLGLAFAILALALSLALAAGGWPRAPPRRGAPWWALWLLTAALFLQIELGALLAGNDAGGAYPDWPTIGGSWIPDGYALSLHAATAEAGALQFNHRATGYLVALLCLALGLAAALRGRGPARALALALGALGLGQAALGVANLVTGSGLVLSSLHQAGAVALWCVAIALFRAACLR